MYARRETTLFIYALALNLLGTRFVTTQVRNPRITDRVFNAMLAREGDINFGQLADVTSFNTATKKCGPARGLLGCSMVEMGIYVVDEINRRTDILPNITLGMVILDTCSKDLTALELVTFFAKQSTCNETYNRTESQRNTSGVSSNNGFNEELRSYKVVSIVGPKPSKVATAVGSLISVFEIPEIGLTAASVDLSDKTRYQYYNRLVVPDSYLAKGIVGILQYFGWSYMSVVYNSGSYGESAYAQISSLVKTLPDICIAIAKMISPVAVDAEFDTIADALIANEDARIVALFIDDLTKAIKFFTAVRKKRRVGTFIYIGTESLSGYEYEPKMLDMLNGVFVIVNPSFVMPDFNNYITSVTAAKSKGNSWITRLWEDKYGCTFNQSSTAPRCSMNLTLDLSLCPADPAQYNRIYDGYNIFATNLHGYIVENCPDGFAHKEILSDCIRGKQLLQRLRSTTFYGILGKIKLNQNGDLIGNLIIKQFYLPTPNAARAVSKPVGLWNTTSLTMTFNDSALSWTVYYENATDSPNFSRPITSICSQPCPQRQFMVVDAAKDCCWSCLSCRNNEIVIDDRRSCNACEIFQWPDESDDTKCSPIDPDFLQISNFIALALLCLTALVFILMTVCAYRFLDKRKSQLIAELGIHLKLTTIFGVLVGCIDVITLLIYPGTSEYLCSVRNVLFHLGTTVIFAPQLVKVVRIYRKHSSGRVLVDEPRSADLEMLAVSALLLPEVVLVVAMEISARAVATRWMPNIFTKYIEIYCYQKTAMFLIPLCYNIAIMLVCACVGFFCRKLPMDYNESSFMFISVSTTLFSWVVFIPAYFSVPQMHLQPAILGFALTLNSLITLLVQFCPVIYTLEFTASKKMTGPSHSH